MKKHCVALQKTGQFSGFFLDYLEGKDKLRQFYSHLPQLGSFEEAIAAKDFPQKNREIIHQSLIEQYGTLELESSVSENIASLLQPTTFTVTTGHQLNLFTGPLYFIYKIVSTINLAKKLKATYPGHHFVPVYWMATEDHDFAEINYFKLDGKKYQWNSTQTGAVGDFALDEGFQNFLKEVSFAPEVFLKAYKECNTLAQAVRKYVNSLFGKEGLLVVDGNDSGLKSIFSPVIKADLTAHSPFTKAMEATQQLEKIGYKSQIFPREINLFYLADGLRERIERKGDQYQVLNTDISFSQNQLLELANTQPERFSPNVVLRPLYQEMILPNLAYLGGPAEVVYWLQLKGVFDHFQVPFPILLPRNFALILDSLTCKKMDQLGWSVEDVFTDFDSWKKEYVQNHAEVDFSLAQEKDQLAQLFTNKGTEAQKLEKSLGDAFEAGKVRSLKILEQLGAKLRKAEERRQQVILDRAKHILDFTAPGGSPQERVVNMMQFYLSNPDLIDQLLAIFDPLDFQMLVLQPE